MSTYKTWICKSLYPPFTPKNQTDVILVHFLRHFWMANHWPIALEHWYMWGDQAEWVVCRGYLFWEITNYSMKFLLYLIVFKTKLFECFHKWITKLKFYSAQRKTHFAWSHHIYTHEWVHRLYTSDKITLCQINTRGCGPRGVVCFLCDVILVHFLWHFLMTCVPTSKPLCLVNVCILQVPNLKWTKNPWQMISISLQGT